MKKKLFIVVLLAFIVFLGFQETGKAEEPIKKGKIGVVVSELSEAYSFLQRPGGTYNGQTVVPKDLYSSIKNKRIKAKLLLESLGYDVSYVTDDQLKDATKLKEYDSIFFADTVMMSYEQRAAVKEYIKDGGGAIFAYAFARNDSGRYPYQANQIDTTPVIYDTESWIYEWDNASEMFQSAFINDVVVGDYSIAPPAGASHPIMTNTLKKAPDFKLNTSKTTKQWIEVIKPYSGSRVTPLLVYNHIGYSSVPEHTPLNTGAAYAIEYGKGKAVWFGFQPMDYMEVSNDLSTDWQNVNPNGDPEPMGEAWDGLQGGEGLKVLVDESVSWTAEKNETNHLIDHSTTISLTDLSAYPRANDYVVYGTMTAVNNGHAVSRGNMVAEVLDPAGKPIRTYTKYVVGLTPGQKSYPEKLSFSLPKNLTPGNYTLRVTYHSGKNGKQQYETASSQVNLSIAKASQKAVIQRQMLKDIPDSFWASKEIYQLRDSGLINGYSNGYFLPQNHVTRLQAAMILARALKLDTKNRPNPGLKDVKAGQYGYDVISAVVDEGIFSGSNGYFNPNKLLTREQMAKILVNSFELTGKVKMNFSDVQPGGWSEPFISTLLANDVTQVQGAFRPSQYTNRAQFAAFVQRALAAAVK